MPSLQIVTASPEETKRIGQRIGELARPGDVILLQGRLGAGKTTFVQGIAEGLGVREIPSSPTFTLVNQYRGRLELYHIDLYRLERPEEAETLGLDDYLYGDGICVVEWPERAWHLWPSHRLLIRIDYIDPEHRRLTLEPKGSRYAELVRTLAQHLGVEAGRMSEDH